jgi:high affinity Mn2+ porin
MVLKNTASKIIGNLLIIILCVLITRLCAAQGDDPETSPGTALLDRFHFKLELTSVVQGSMNNNHNYKRVPGYPTRRDRTKLMFVSDIMLEADLWQGAVAFLRFEAGDGNGLSRHTDGFTGTNDNVLAYDTKLAELWVEQALFDDRLVVTLGKLDPFAYFDGNAVANDERTQFLSAQFVNSLAIDSPDYAYGARVSYVPRTWVGFSAGVFEDGDKFANIFDDRLSIVEVALMPKMFGREGVYRLYAWHNSTDHEKLRDPRRTGVSGKGMGISVDQYLSDDMCVFARWGTQDSDVYEVGQSWSLGLRVRGTAWKRPQDEVAVAYGKAVLSGGMREQLRGDGIRTAAEGRMEAYYRCRLNQYVSISPDVQVVHGLAGADKANTVTILGLRMHVAF